MKPSTKEILEREHSLVAIRWAAYKTIRNGGVYSIGNKQIYDSVRKRLKKMFMEDEEKLSRFRYLDGA